MSQIGFFSYLGNIASSTEISSTTNSTSENTPATISVIAKTTKCPSNTSIEITSPSVAKTVSSNTNSTIPSNKPTNIATMLTTVATTATTPQNTGAHHFMI